MTPEQFVYWLQGFAEVSPQAELSKTQWQIIKDHLAEVFEKQTPNRSPRYAPAIMPSDEAGKKFPPLPMPSLDLFRVTC